MYYSPCQFKFFLNGLINMQSWYNGIRSLLLYFVNSQSVPFLPLMVRVCPRNDMIGIFLQDAWFYRGGGGGVSMTTEQCVFVRCSSLIYLFNLPFSVDNMHPYLSTDKYHDSIPDLSAECLLWGFSLNKASKCIWQKPCFSSFLVISEMFRKSDLKKAYISVAYICAILLLSFCYYSYKYYYC